MHLFLQRLSRWALKPLSPREQALLLTILFAAFCVPLAAHAWLGWYNRFMADDYCAAAIARAEGIWSGSLWYYQHWTGRFSFNCMRMLLSASISPYVPGMLLLLWWGALVAALTLCFSRAQHTGRAAAAALAAAMLAVTFQLTPSIEQSYYWNTMALSYELPFMLFPLALCLLYVRLRPALALTKRLPLLALAFSTAFFLAGCSETFAAVQAAVLTMLAAAERFSVQREAQRRREILRCLLAGLAGAVAGMLIMIIAPGNVVRQAFFPPAPGVLPLLAISGEGLLRFAEHAAASQNMLYLLWLFVFSLLLGAGALGQTVLPAAARNQRYLAAATPGIVCFLLLVCFMPAAYGMSALPPPRTWCIPTYIAVSGSVFWGCLLGACGAARLQTFFAQRHLYLRMAVWGILWWGVLQAPHLSLEVYQKLPGHRAYAAAWDAMDRAIYQAKAAGRACVVVPPLRNPADLGDIGSDPQDWVNQCASRYYGITVVTKACP